MIDSSLKREPYGVEWWSRPDEFQDNFMGALLQPGWDVSIHLDDTQKYNNYVISSVKGVIKQS